MGSPLKKERFDAEAYLAWEAEHDYAGEPDCRFDSIGLTLSLATVFEDVDPAE